MREREKRGEMRKEKNRKKWWTLNIKRKKRDRKI